MNQMKYIKANESMNYIVTYLYLTIYVLYHNYLTVIGEGVVTVAKG